MHIKNVSVNRNGFANAKAFQCGNHSYNNNSVSYLRSIAPGCAHILQNSSTGSRTKSMRNVFALIFFCQPCNAHKNPTPRRDNKFSDPLMPSEVHIAHTKHITHNNYITPRAHDNFLIMSSFKIFSRLARATRVWSCECSSESFTEKSFPFYVS